MYVIYKHSIISQGLLLSKINEVRKMRINVYDLYNVYNVYVSYFAIVKYTIFIT